MDKYRLYRISGEFAVVTQAPSIGKLPIFTGRRTRLSSGASLMVACLALVVCAGCTPFTEYVRNGFKVGPNYQKPPAPVADNWIDSKSKGVNTAASDVDRWWTVFNDPKLNGLIEQAYNQNLDLRTAGTRILAARATRNIAAGNLFPQLQEAFASYSHVGLSGSV